MHQGNLLRDIGQIQRFFHSGVTATDHGDVLVAIEEPITGGTGGYTLAHEGFFGRQTKITGGGAGSDDQGVTGVLTLIAGEHEGPLVQLDLVDVVKDNFGLETLGMLAHALHQIRALQTFHVTRPVIDVSGGGQLTTHLHTGDQQWLQVGPRCIDSCAVASRARAQDNQTGMACFRHCFLQITAAAA